jgi:hypothetical protein
MDLTNVMNSEILHGREPHLRGDRLPPEHAFPVDAATVDPQREWLPLGGAAG